jgi:hypothetical protein
MGRLMIATHAKVWLLAALLGAVCVPATAQPDLEEDRPSPPENSALQGIVLIAIWASQPYLVSQKCGIGDPEVWPRIFVALDKRILHCAERHSAWQAKRQEAVSIAPQFGVTNPTADTLAQASFRMMVAKFGADADKGNANEMCAPYRPSALWKDLLAPGSVPADEAAAAWAEEAVREDENSHHCGRGLCPRFYRDIRRLGDDQSWVTAPCAELLPKAK